MVVIDKCREYCKRMSTSEEHYKFILDNIFVVPHVRNKECSRPDNLCETCDLNQFNLGYVNWLWTKHSCSSLKQEDKE